MPQLDSTTPIDQASISSDSPERLRTDPRLLLEVRRLSKLSEPRALFSVAKEWGFVFSAVVLWCMLPEDLGVLRWVLYVASVIVIGARQHALLILVHEAAHFRISQNKGRNELFSDLFCAFPLGIATEIYRNLHLRHHQYINTAKDPDWKIIQNVEEWRWPKAKLSALWIFFSDLIGLGAHKVLAILIRYSPFRRIIYKKSIKIQPGVFLRFVVFYAIAILILTFFDLWFLFFLFWVVPLLTALLPISRLRAIAEHMVVECEHELNSTRHVDCNRFERFLVAPLNVNYHLTHHLYPSIPCYNLPEMHKILMREEVFRDNAHLTAGYWGLRSTLWQELTEPRSH